jgi:hypothetical protein
MRSATVRVLGWIWQVVSVGSSSHRCRMAPSSCEAVYNQTLTQNYAEGDLGLAGCDNVYDILVGKGYGRTSVRL